MIVRSEPRAGGHRAANAGRFRRMSLHQPLGAGRTNLRYNANDLLLNFMFFRDVEMIGERLKQIFSIDANIAIDDLIGNLVFRFERYATEKRQMIEHAV